jgi:hypothetical protein
MKLINGDKNYITIEISAEEAIGIFMTLLYSLDQIREDDFSTLLHFSPKTATLLMKDLQAVKREFDLNEEIENK